MTGTVTSTETRDESVEDEAASHVDVLIVGAGLSGIGAACRLESELPTTSYAILEARGASGGTWDLFRYPGVRSDSDMFTLGYPFRPWRGPQSIADGSSILGYLRETAAAYGVDRKIRYHCRVVRSDWSSEKGRWTVTVEQTETGILSRRTCDFLYLCPGYYRHDQGYSPSWPGQEAFTGRVVHPQHWPPDLDVTGRRVVVIGSGATAVTLVPALARTAAHVTMLQRSPSFVMTLPSRDPLAGWLARVLPAGRAAAVMRRKNTVLATSSYVLARRHPAQARALLTRSARKRLPSGFDLDTHFTPRYDVWDQRLCIAPDGDFFAALRSGRADVVTDEIETFTPTDLRLRSGRELTADVVVSATGLNLLVLGGVELAVDGEPVVVHERVAYQGMMLDGVPNLAFAIGYTNASWTLKVDLVSSYVVRLLRHLRDCGFAAVTPRLAAEPMITAPLIEMTSGYFERARATLPLQGDRPPWRLQQHYFRDRPLFRGPIDVQNLEFRRVAASAP